jgi:hypothetical protein
MARIHVWVKELGLLFSFPHEVLLCHFCFLKSVKSAVDCKIVFGPDIGEWVCHLIFLAAH